MRIVLAGFALFGLVTAGCGEGSIQGPPTLSEDSGVIGRHMSAEDLNRITNALTTSSLTGHCAVLHLFGSPHWVETGMCVGSNGTTCPTGGSPACFNGRTQLNAVVGMMCAYRVDLRTTCSIPGDAPTPVADTVSTPTVAVQRATAAGDTAWVVAKWRNPATMAPNDSISTSYYRSGVYQFTSSHHTHGTSDSARVAVTVPVGSSQAFKVCATNKYWSNGTIVLSSGSKCSTTVTWVRTKS